MAWNEWTMPTDLMKAEAKAKRHRDNWKRRAYELRSTLEDVLRSVDYSMTETRARARQLLDRDEELYRTDGGENGGR